MAGSFVKTDAVPQTTNPAAVPRFTVFHAPSDEIVNIDKWNGNTNQPESNFKRLRSYSLASLTALAFVPVLGTPAIHINSQPTEPIAVQSFQYDDRTEPLKPITSVETITVDKWFRRIEVPLFKPKRLVQYGVNCAIAEQADDGLPPVHWIPETETPSFASWKAIRKQYLYPTSVSDQLFNIPAPPQVTAVYIGAQSAEPLRLVTFQYDDRTEPLKPIVTGGETITVDKWHRNYPDLVFRAKRLADYGSYRDLITRVEVTTPDKWQSDTNRPRFDLKRNQYLYPTLSGESRLFVAPGVEVVTVDKWNRNYPDIIYKAKRSSTYGLYIVDAKQLTQVEPPTLNKWVQPTQRPRFDKKRNQYQFPSVFYDVTSFLAIADFLAMQKDVRSITLYTGESGTITLYTLDAGAIDNLTGNSGAIFLLVKDDGIIE